MTTKYVFVTSKGNDVSSSSLGQAKMNKIADKSSQRLLFEPSHVDRARHN